MGKVRLREDQWLSYCAFVTLARTWASRGESSCLDLWSEGANGQGGGKNKVNASVTWVVKIINPREVWRRTEAIAEA